MFKKIMCFLEGHDYYFELIEKTSKYKKVCSRCGHKSLDNYDEKFKRLPRLTMHTGPR